LIPSISTGLLNILRNFQECPRFSLATEGGDEDWLLDMPDNYKLFWFYACKCDHAGNIPG